MAAQLRGIWIVSLQMSIVTCNGQAQTKCVLHLRGGRRRSGRRGSARGGAGLRGGDAPEWPRAGSDRLDLLLPRGRRQRE